MLSLRILVPVYREHQWMKDGFKSTWAWLGELPEALGRRIEVCFCVWIQDDKDHDLVGDLQAFQETLPESLASKVVSGSGDRPSVAASLLLGLNTSGQSSGSTTLAPYTLICPIDCSPTSEGLRELLQVLDTKARPTDWMVFAKRYEPSTSSLALSLSAWSQNHIFSPWFGLHCWTHLFVVPSDLLPELLTVTGFLEDLSLNKTLTQRLGRPIRLGTRASISGRRYAKRGAPWQIWSNIHIFFWYLMGRRSRDALRKIHES